MEEKDIGTWCVECGADVEVDEVGNCACCDAQAMGPGVDAALRIRASLLCVAAQRNAMVKKAQNIMAGLGSIDGSNLLASGEFAVAKQILDAGEAARMVSNAEPG